MTGEVPLSHAKATNWPSAVLEKQLFSPPTTEVHVWYAYFIRQVSTSCAPMASIRWTRSGSARTPLADLSSKRADVRARSLIEGSKY
jgi:hypothetical protein